MICFISLALLWIFRDIPGFGGWADLFTRTKKYVDIYLRYSVFLLQVIMCLTRRYPPSILKAF